MAICFQQRPSRLPDPYNHRGDRVGARRQRIRLRHAERPCFAAEVMDVAGVEPEPDMQEDADEAQDVADVTNLDAFSDFLDTLDFDDFDGEDDKA